MPTTLFFDESGFTGDKLLDPDQPFFCLASTAVDDEAAAAILRDCFPRYRGEEFKFKTMWKRPGHRDGFRALARRLPALKDPVLIWLVNKRFAVLTKMIDYLCEPLSRGAGFDFYKNGFAPRFANWIHFAFENLAQDEVYDELLRAYDALARSPSRNAVERLARTARRLRRQVPDEVEFFLEQVELGAYLLVAEGRLDTFEDTSEMQLTSVMTSVIRWRQRRAEDFNVVMDESSSFLAQKDLWDAATRSDMPPRLQLLGDGSTVEFPLRVFDTRAIRSHDSPAVQLADLLAGLFARAGRELIGTANDRFLRELVELGLGEVSYAGILPRAEFPLGPPQPADGPDAVDLMTEILAPALERRASKRADRDAGR